MSELDLTVHEYSEKSIVVRGEDTKLYKEELKDLGGKYNSRLKGGPGWIFSKRYEDKVLSFVCSGQVKVTNFVPKHETKSNYQKNAKRVLKSASAIDKVYSDIESLVMNMSDQQKLEFISRVTTIVTQDEQNTNIIIEDESDNDYIPVRILPRKKKKSKKKKKSRE